MHGILFHQNQFRHFASLFQPSFVRCLNQEHNVRTMAWVRISLDPRVSQGESGNQIGFNKLHFTPLKLDTEENI